MARDYGALRGGVVIKLPLSYRVDFSRSAQGRVVEWVEAKKRTNAHDYYVTYFLSLGKVLAGIQMMRETKLPFTICVRFTDGLYAVPPHVVAKWDDLRMGGRTDRDDWQDEEPMVHWRASRLVRLG